MVTGYVGGENVLTITKKQLKSNLLWKSPCVIRKRLDDEMFEVENLKSKEVFDRHESALWKLEYVQGDNLSGRS